IAGAIGVVVIGGLGITFAVKSNNEKQEQLAAAAEQKRIADEEQAKLKAQMAEQLAKVDGLKSQLDSAKDEATRLALQKQLDEERAKADKMKPGGGGGPRPSTGSGAGPTKPACNCTPGDPLCSCL